ncbi:MAG: hypothetical protein IT236_08845, partial [Bacteroidia bacterium]|nr:hypothetical protein [Bacteroidia bacterium]
DLFQALVKTTVSQKEWGALSIRSQAGNKLAVGAKVNYTFEGPRPQKIELLGPQGIYKDWTQSPGLFTPRVLYWLVSKPDGDVDSERMKDATEYTFNFEADKQGVYTVMAVVLTESNEIQVLRDYLNIVSVEQIANEAFEKNEGLSKDHFNKLQTSLLINKMRLQNPVKENLGSVIVSNRNPAYFHESDNTSETYQVNFQLKNPQKNESYLWYVTADDKSVLNNSENYYFSLSHVNKTKVADMPDGNRAFSTMQLFEPELNKAQIALYFPMAKKLPDSIKYKVVCERYQNGKLTGVENFIQYYNNQNSRQEQQRKEQLNETQIQLKGMEEARRKIDGPVLPINAMYVNEEQGISNAISVFYGKSKKQDKNKPTAYIVVDLTRNVETTYYEGETLVDALQNFNDWQSYPDGLIKLKAEGINYIIKTKGGSTLHYVSSRAGLYSMLTFAGGVLTFFVPGAQGVSAFLMTSAFTLGFAAAGLGLVDSLAKDKLNAREITLDVLQLATSLMGLRATKLKALSEAKGITTLTGTAKYLDYGVAVGDGVQGLIISKDAADEINAILLDKKLNDNEKLIKLSQVLVGFLATMAIIVVSTAETQTLKTNLQNKGVPNSLIKNLAKEPSELILLDVLTKDEVEVTLKRGQDLLERAKQKIAIERLKVHEAEYKKVAARHQKDLQDTKAKIKRTFFEKIGKELPDNWNIFKPENNVEFAKKLKTFRGNDDLTYNPKLSGGEGQLFESPLTDNQVMKRWFENRVADMPKSIKLLKDAKKLIESSPNLSKVLDVVSLGEHGKDWVIRGFDRKSSPLKDAIVSPFAVQARQQAITLLSGQEGSLAKSILKKLNNNSENLHWSPTDKKILIIDMQ